MIDTLHTQLFRALQTHGSCTCGTRPRPEQCAFHQALQAYEIRLAAQDAAQKEKKS